MPQEKKLLIIDANAIIHRAFHALPPLKTKSGEIINAVYGFCLMFLRALKEIKPDYIAAAFDSKGPTFRHEQFKEYKAKRVKAPDELYSQIGIVKDVLGAFSVPVFEKQGYEADDLIATICFLMQKKQVMPKPHIVILSGDMDNLQLVNEHVKVYTMRKGIKDTVLYGPKEVKEKYGGLTPEQIVDFKALNGDQSDGIPGITGVGEKTAIQILNDFGSLENLYKEVEENTKKAQSLKPGLLQKIKDYKEQAFISQKLAKMDEKAPIDFNLKDIEFGGFDQEKAKDVLQKLEFHTLLDRFFEFKNKANQTSKAKPQTKQAGLFAGAATKGDDIKAEIKKLEQSGILSEDLANLELKLKPIVEQMEKNGIKVDLKKFNELSLFFEKEIIKSQSQIFKLAGKEFNLNSPSQLSEVLFSDLKISPLGVKKTPGGAISTNAEELKKLSQEHPIVNLIMEYREVFKLKTGFVDALPRMINSKTGRIHPHFHQLGTETGRMSCSEPNLQNIPIKTELGKKIRECFIPEKGFVFLSADYSQMELRIAASLASDKEMIEAFNKGEDIHTLTASRIFKVLPEEVNEKQRYLSKCVAKGTIISTSKGLLPIEKLSSAQEYCFSPVKFNVKQENSFAPATAFYNGGVQPAILINSSYGYSLEATPNHRIRVINSQGQYVWKFLRDIKINDLVAIKRGAGSFGRNQKLTFVFRRRANRNSYFFPFKMSSELGRFLGYVVGEGYLNFGKTSATLSIFNNNPEVIKDLKLLSLKLFGKKPTALKRKNGIILSWSNSRLVEMLQQLEIGKTSKEKVVPSAVMVASKKAVANFLSALFESDGSISKSYVTFSSKSKKLIDQVQMLLLNFGIIARREDWEIKKYGTFYKLYLVGRESRIKFFKDIGFVSKTKQMKLEKLTQRRFTSERIYLPNQTEVLKILYPFTRNDTKERIHACIRTKSPTIHLTYQRLKKILNEFPNKDLPEYLALKEQFNRNIFYDTIVKIKKSKVQTYDLVVPSKNTYLASGFVSHNTISFGVLYGLGPFGFAGRTGVPFGEAKKFIEQYFQTFQGIAKFVKETIEKTKEQGFCETIFGRKRFLPEINSKDARIRAQAERIARNFPVQGTAADIMKMAMVELKEKKLLNNNCRLLLQIHDELLFEVKENIADKIKQPIEEAMENAVALKVPMKVKINKGVDWGKV